MWENTILVVVDTTAGRDQPALERAAWLATQAGGRLELFACEWDPDIDAGRIDAKARDQLLKTRERSLEELLPDRLHVDLLTGIPRLEVPVFLFVGRHDYNTPFALVEQWVARLRAPRVELVWFEGAGHMIPIEAPEEFQARLVEKLLPLAAR